VAEPHAPVLDDNFLLDLALTTLLTTRERCLIRAPLTDATRASGGTAALGVLLAAADIGACEPALVACDPDWTATQDMSLHGAGWLDEGPAVLDCRLLRVGKKVVVVSVDVYDGQGRQDLPLLQEAVDAGHLPHAGRGLVTFARLPRTAARASDADGFQPAGWVGEVRQRSAGLRATGPLGDRMGMRVLDAARGVLELPFSSYVANSIGTVNGGVQTVLLQLAAEGARPGRDAVDAQVHFLAQLRQGPVRTAVTVLRDTDEHTVMEVRLFDSGADDHLLTLAYVTLRAR
jgi:acyl-coenzyme A thioesterase PaaI-like protein